MSAAFENQQVSGIRVGALASKQLRVVYLAWPLIQLTLITAPRKPKMSELTCSCTHVPPCVCIRNTGWSPLNLTNDETLVAKMAN